jgi:hypothetical protein
MILAFAALWIAGFAWLVAVSMRWMVRLKAIRYRACALVTTCAVPSGASVRTAVWFARALVMFTPSRVEAIWKGGLPGFAEPGRDRRSRPAGTGGGRNSPRRCQCL